ncbi:Cleavage and polyadenylation specificity factor subunit 1, partial [Modicella reniformis]
MICDGKIGCFTQFHNLNCKHGFITLNAEGNLKISQLLTEGVPYDMPWPIRKVPLKRRMKYHPTSQTYVTITAIPDPFVDGKWYSNGQAKAKSTGPGFRPLYEKQTLELVSPVTWETVEYEMVTSIETVFLESSQDESGRKKFMLWAHGISRAKTLLCVEL